MYTKYRNTLKFRNFPDVFMAVSNIKGFTVQNIQIYVEYKYKEVFIITCAVLFEPGNILRVNIFCLFLEIPESKS